MSISVLYISDAIPVGGASKSLIDVVSSMVQKGVTCYVCVSNNDEYANTLRNIGANVIVSGHMAAMEVPPKEKWKRIPVYLIRQFQYKQALKNAIKNIEQAIDVNKIDLIHTNSARNDLGCIIAGKYNIPHIVHLREFGDSDFGCWEYRKNYAQYLNRHTDYFIAISNAVKTAWCNKGIDSNRIKIIYNGVDNELIKEKNYSSDFSNLLKLVIVGGVCEAKGQLQAVEAIGMLEPDIRKNVSLDIIGWGDSKYLNEIKTMINNTGINNNVNILGSRNDVYDLLQNYDVGLMCSVSEGFGRVTIEYMHAGLAVIASNAGANGEIIENGRTGILYELNDTADLASSIKSLYIDRNKMRSYAEAGKKKAKEAFIKKQNANNIYSFYNSIIKKQ